MTSAAPFVEGEARGSFRGQSGCGPLLPDPGRSPDRRESTDELLQLHGTLAEPSEMTIRVLDAVLPETWSRRSPIDIIGHALPERMRDTVRVLLEHAQDLDALLVLDCPTAVASPEDCARALLDGVHASGSDLPLLTSRVSEETASPGRKILNEAGIATYDTPIQAVTTFMKLVEYCERQESLRETRDDSPDETREEPTPDGPPSSSSTNRSRACTGQPQGNPKPGRFDSCSWPARSRRGSPPP